MALGNYTADRLAQIREGTYQGPSDVQDHYLWDTLAIPSSTTTNGVMSFFTAPQSPTKPLAKTNLQDAGKLPTGQAFVAVAIRPQLDLSFASGALPNVTDAACNLVNDFYRVLENSAVQFEISGRQYDLQAPAGIWQNPVALSVGSADVATSLVARVGDYNHKGWVSLNTPIIIGELVNFKLNLYLNSSDTLLKNAIDALAAAGCSIKWIMRGTLERLK